MWDYVGLCRTMWDYVGLCGTMWDKELKAEGRVGRAETRRGQGVGRAGGGGESVAPPPRGLPTATAYLICHVDCSLCEEYHGVRDERGAQQRLQSDDQIRDAQPNVALRA